MLQITIQKLQVPYGLHRVLCAGVVIGHVTQKWAENKLPIWELQDVELNPVLRAEKINSLRKALSNNDNGMTLSLLSLALWYAQVNDIDSSEKLQTAYDIVSDDQTSDNNDEFSVQPCELCHSPLGGTRHAVVAQQVTRRHTTYNKRSSIYDRLELSVCRDCFDALFFD